MTKASKTVSAPAIDPAPNLWEAITLLRAMADAATPVLLEHDEIDASGATSRHSRFIALVNMTESKLLKVINAADAASITARALERIAA